MWWLPHDHPGPRAADLVGPVRSRLSDDVRDAILTVKEAAAANGESLAGIWVYQAVLDHGVRSYADFLAWRAQTGTDGLTSWLPVTRP